MAGLCIFYHRSPVGWLKITATESAIIGLSFVARGGRSNPNLITARAVAQLQEYFAGRRFLFDLPLVLTGTPFQQKIWQAIAKIPFGKTVSYARLAARSGHPQAYRAAGSATGKNPLCIIIPCHRVIAADGRLGGFSGSIGVKKRLLELEGWLAVGRAKP